MPRAIRVLVCTCQKISNAAKYRVLLALQFEEASVRCILPGGTGKSYNWHNQSFRSIRTCAKPYSPIDMVSLCHPPVEDDTIIRYIIYKRKSRPFRCPFIHLYVPAVTPRLHPGVAALQFVENTLLTCFCCVKTSFVSEQSMITSRCRGGITDSVRTPQ